MNEDTISSKVRVNVTVIPEGKKYLIGIPLDWTVERFISEFARKLGLPYDKYTATLQRTNAILPSSEKIENIRLQEADTIIIRADIVGGGYSEDSLEFTYDHIIKQNIQSNLSKGESIPLDNLEQLMTLASNENAFYQKKIAIYYLFFMYSILIICTLIILFLQGFRLYGFNMDADVLKLLGASVLGEVAGLAALVYGSLFKTGMDNTE